MKSFLVALIAALVALAAPTASLAGEHATPDEAQAMVKKAIAYIKANGREKAFAEISRPTGQFVDRDLYVTVMDMSGRSLASGGNAKMIGKDLSDFKDADGKYLVRERLEVAKTKGSGWQEYKSANGPTKKIEHKSAYFEKFEDIVITAGIYKG